MSLKLNEACCSLPVVKSNYEPKGTESTYAGLRTYTIGKASNQTAIIAIYDIFGLDVAQTKQGADILASALDTLVIMPDFFEGQAWTADKMPPKTDEQKKALGELLNVTGAPPKNIEKLGKVIEQLQSEGVTKVACYGLCWGGKIATRAGASTLAPNPVKAVASLHPGLLDADDAKGLKVPFACFPSKDEDASKISQMEKDVSANEAIASKSVFKTYSTVHHGWAAARGDMNDPETKKQYESVHKNLVSFFQQVL